MWHTASSCNAAAAVPFIRVLLTVYSVACTHFSHSDDAPRLAYADTHSSDPSGATAVTRQTTHIGPNTPPEAAVPMNSRPLKPPALKMSEPGVDHATTHGIPAPDQHIERAPLAGAELAVRLTSDGGVTAPLPTYTQWQQRGRGVTDRPTTRAFPSRQEGHAASDAFEHTSPETVHSKKT